MYFNFKISIMKSVFKITASVETRMRYTIQYTYIMWCKTCTVSVYNPKWENRLMIYISWFYDLLIFKKFFLLFSNSVNCKIHTHTHTSHLNIAGKLMKIKYTKIKLDCIIKIRNSQMKWLFIKYLLWEFFFFFFFFLFKRIFLKKIFTGDVYVQGKLLTVNSQITKLLNIKGQIFVFVSLMIAHLLTVDAYGFYLICDWSQNKIVPSAIELVHILGKLSKFLFLYSLLSAIKHFYSKDAAFNFSFITTKLI